MYTNIYVVFYIVYFYSFLLGYTYDTSIVKEVPPMNYYIPTTLLPQVASLKVRKKLVLYECVRVYVCVCMYVCMYVYVCVSVCMYV